MSNIVKVEQGQEIDLNSLSGVLAKSGYFSDVRDAAQAMVKVLAGQEMGLGPIAAMTGIYIVKGRVTLSANLMASLVKRSGRYNYRVAEMSNANCKIVFYEQGQEIGVSEFSADDAKAAGLWGSSDPWKKTPRNMLFARAMSNGVKWYCPDIGSGPLYTPDELESAVPVDLSTGETIEVQPAPRAAALPQKSERDLALDEMRAAYKVARARGAELMTPDKDAVAKMSIEEIRDWARVYADAQPEEAEFTLDEATAE